MDVSRPPRAPLAALPTPLMRAPGLERALGCGPILIKRDDLTGFGLAGNKARSLEFLVGAALADGCDVFVAAGSPESNFCAAAAMAARVAGIECELLYPGEPPSPPAANVELARAAGARLVFGTVDVREQLDDAVRHRAERLRTEGRRPYAVPRGGATAVGAWGYVEAARELAEQCRSIDLTPATIVVPTGSGGTQAGLLAGQVGYGLPGSVVGASVSRPGPEMAEQVLRISRAVATAASWDAPVLTDVDVRDCRGPGFGVASAEDHVSARLALHHEGLLLDDHYGAKAMTLLRTMLTTGDATPAVFWHTGGVATTLSHLVGRAS